ncbi:MAG TPA: hypothetical protein VFC47_11520 [Caulobacteraceae bacterium]|nr:hypothetical protein [Caulobacteraceae bacterium]
MMLITASFVIAGGKTAEAMEYLTKVAGHIKSLTGSEYRILSRLTGAGGHVVLSTTHENAAAWEAARMKIYGDATWQKMTADAGTAGLFAPGSIELALWQES